MGLIWGVWRKWIQVTSTAPLATDTDSKWRGQELGYRLAMGLFLVIGLGLVLVFILSALGVGNSDSNSGNRCDELNSFLQDNPYDSGAVAREYVQECGGSVDDSGKIEAP